MVVLVGVASVRLDRVRGYPAMLFNQAESSEVLSDAECADSDTGADQRITQRRLLECGVAVRYVYQYQGQK